MFNDTKNYNSFFQSMMQQAKSDNQEEEKESQLESSKYF